MTDVPVKCTPYTYVMPPHERALFIPGSADLDDLLKRLAASRK